MSDSEVTPTGTVRRVVVTEEYVTGEMAEVLQSSSRTGNVDTSVAFTENETSDGHRKDLHKTATAKSTGSALLTEDQVVAMKMAEAREKRLAREARRQERETRRKQRGFFDKMRKHPEDEDTDDEDGEERKKREAELNNTISFFDLFRFARPVDYIFIALGAFGSIAFGIAMPLMTIIFSDMMGIFTDYQIALTVGVNMAEARNTFDDGIVKYAIYFVILGAATFVVAYLQQSMWMISGENQTSEMRRQYLSSILQQNIAWFDATPSGDLTSRITGDVNLVQEGVSEKVGIIIQSVCTFLSGFIIAFVRGWKLALVLMCAFPVLATAGALMGRVVSTSVSGGQDAYAKAGSVAEEVISGVKTVSAFGAQDREVRRYEEKLDVALQQGRRKGLAVGLSVGFMMCVMFLTYALGFWYGSRLVAKHEMTPAEVLNVFFALIIGTMTIGMAATPMSAIQSAQGAAKKIFGVIDRESTIDYSREDGERPSNIQGNIEIRDVNFSYPSRPDVQILRDFTLSIKAGQTVALVGSSGSGKSTIVALLERFYNPDSGSITLDGLPIEQINLRHLRKHVGLVGQEPVLFQDSIKQNIMWGSAAADTEAQPTQEEVEAACRAANVHDFIMTLPKGYDTLVGEKGALLSGGQKQRIAIARALVRNPKILLLDEATSALDTESEKLVQDALDRAATGRTTIVIAHRLSTIRDADVIVVMNRGKIYEVGQHDDLLARDGMYAKLVHAQRLRTEKDQDRAQEATLDTSSLEGDEDESTEQEEADEETNIVINADQPATKPLAYAKTKDTVISEKDVDEVVKKLRQERAKKATPFRRVLKLNLPEIRFILPALLGSLVDGAIMPTFAVVFTKVLAAFSITDMEKMKHELDFWSLMFVVLAIATFFAVFARIGLFIISGEHLVHRIRKLVFAAILRQEMGFFDDKVNSTGILCAKLSTEAEMVNGIAGRLIGVFIQMATTGVVGLALALAYGWKLTLVVLACVPALGIANMLNVRMIFSLNSKTKVAYESSAAVACEAVENIRTVASLGREDTFIRRYTEAIAEPHRISVRSALVSAISFGASQSLVFLTYSVALYYGSRLILNGEYAVQDVFQVMFAVIFSAMAISQTSGFAPDVAKAKLAAVEIFEMLDRATLIDPTDPNGKVADTFTGQVKASDVHFRYPARRNVRVLRGIDLDVPQGKTIALVGSSGCGKSTMVGLIERFYDTESGKVAVDGIDTKEWQLSKLRSEISLVGQEPILFDMSIRDNIAYGLAHATEEQIHQAARDANIYDFVTALPDGFDTSVGERGSQLSGGQKQRVAIARAIIRNPRLLLLDEATSALDTESEKVVQDALDRASVGRTTITIAHRLSTIQDADVIYVFKDGRILESGKHGELLANKGLYYALVQKQSLARKKDLESS